MSFENLSITSQGYLQKVINTINKIEPHLGTANIASDGYLREVATELAIPRTNIIPRRKKIIKEEDEELLLILKTLIKIWH